MPGKPVSSTQENLARALLCAGCYLRRIKMEKADTAPQLGPSAHTPRQGILVCTHLLGELNKWGGYPSPQTASVRSEWAPQNCDSRGINYVTRRLQAGPQVRKSWLDQDNHIATLQNLGGIRVHCGHSSSVRSRLAIKCVSL